MKKNRIVMATAVLLAIAISVPLSFGAVTGTVFIGNNEVTLIPDPSGGITAGGSGGGTYTPDINHTGYEDGNPVYGIQAPGTTNVVPNGTEKSFDIVIPAGIPFCIKVKERHVITHPTISLKLQGKDFIAGPINTGDLIVGYQYTYFTSKILDSDGKMKPLSALSEVTAPMLFDESVVIEVVADRVGNLGVYPRLELSIIFMNQSA